MSFLYRLLIVINICVIVVLWRGASYFHDQLPQELRTYVEGEIPASTSAGPVLISLAALSALGFLAGSFSGLLLKWQARYLLSGSFALGLVLAFAWPWPGVHPPAQDALTSVSWFCVTSDCRCLVMVESFRK